MKIAVLGAGAWGTAMAVALAPRRSLRLWVRDALQAEKMAEHRVNQRYLPEVALPLAVKLDTDLQACIEHAKNGVALLAVPTAGLRPLLRALATMANTAPLPALLWLSKGFEQQGGSLAHEIFAAEFAEHPRMPMAGPLSGPSFAHEVALGLPVALTVAGPDRLCELATTALHGSAMRMYASSDVIGVEVGGAVKNVLAIATGIADALALGANARAALITRGLAEATRLGTALGARAETFMGLTGVGDIVLTCTGQLSRNRRVGLLLGQGIALNQALAQLGHVAEGVWSAPEVAARASAAGVAMPITAAVCAVLDGRLRPRAALDQLLARDPRREASV